MFARCFSSWRRECITVRRVRGPHYYLVNPASAVMLLAKTPEDGSAGRRSATSHAERSLPRRRAPSQAAGDFTGLTSTATATWWAPPPTMKPLIGLTSP